MRKFVCLVFAAVAVASVMSEDRYVDLGTVHCRVGCACAEDYIPICANDRRTYVNECKLRCKQCDVPGLRAVFGGRCEDHLLLAPTPYAAGGYTPIIASYSTPIVTAAPAPAPTPTVVPQWYYRPTPVVA